MGSTMMVTTPIRPYPTSFPPIGSLSIINYLRRRGVDDVEFYNIDGNRPDYGDVIAHIRARRPDVLGISAVVSTAYGYTKRLATDVKKFLPDTLIVVGGSLAASAEILLRCASVDLCVLGEGEKVMLNVVNRARTSRKPVDFKDIKGLMLLDETGNLVNTGYEEALDRSEIYDIDWDDLERSSKIELFVMPGFDSNGKAFPWFKKDPRAYEPHRRNKKVASLPGAKGCVARCTFCHRWDKGIRYIPPELIVKRLEYLIERYNVGFLSIADENFGTDKKWLAEFCERIKPYDILWQVAGMRVNCVTLDRLKMMRDAGCASIAMGIETGSARMLEVMEKKVDLEDNYNAIRWTSETGIELVPELIMGMPGESTDTVLETAALISFAKLISPDRDPLHISTNYAQALPGTPLYEYARKKGLIGYRLEDEENYLLRISDQNAGEIAASINMTDSPEFVRRSWRGRLVCRVSANFRQKFGREAYMAALKRNPNFIPLLRGSKSASGNAIVDRGLDLMRDPKFAETSAELPGTLELLLKRRLYLLMLLHPVFFDRLPFLILLTEFVRESRHKGYRATIKDALQRWFGATGRSLRIEHDTLRKIVEKKLPPLPGDSPQMAPLRRGR